MFLYATTNNSVPFAGQGAMGSRGNGLATNPDAFYQGEVNQPKSLQQVSPSRFAGKFRRAVAGVTYDSNGAPLAACVLDLFLTATDVKVDSGVSGADGSYELSSYKDGAMYVVAYKAGAPDVAGTTVNTLTGA